VTGRPPAELLERPEAVAPPTPGSGLVGAHKDSRLAGALPPVPPGPLLALTDRRGRWRFKWRYGRPAGSPRRPTASSRSLPGSLCNPGPPCNAVGAGVGGWAQRGAAVVELLVVFVTLMVPLVYVMLVMADVQRALLATSSAAREAGRLYVTGSDRLDAERRAQSGYREVLATYGMDAGDSRARMRLRSGCPPEATPGCAGGFGAGAEVRVVVTYRVPVARVPFLGAVAGPGVTVGATHHTRVDRYRGVGG
jgi:hypothetical protein